MADLIITVGQVKPHYLAGYSGGAKSILPAVASKFSIASNHFMRAHPGAALAVADKNPVRADMEEAARLAGQVFLLNCVLDGYGKPHGFFAGDIVQAHREAACAALDVGGVKASAADVIVVTSQPPVSASVYQFTKAVAPAARVVMQGGIIIAVGSCSEGVGDRFIINEIIYKLGFRHRIPRGVDIYLVSDLKDREVDTTFFRPVGSLQAGLDLAARRFKRKFSVNFLQEAGLLVPYLEGENPSDWI